MGVKGGIVSNFCVVKVVLELVKAIILILIMIIAYNIWLQYKHKDVFYMYM
jgi:hypothetical protein